MALDELLDFDYPLPEYGEVSIKENIESGVRMVGETNGVGAPHGRVMFFKHGGILICHVVNRRHAPGKVICVKHNGNIKIGTTLSGEEGNRVEFTKYRRPLVKSSANESD